MGRRIERETPWKATAGCALGMGIVVGLIAGVIIFMCLRHDDYGLPLIVGSAFGLVALLLLYSGIHQLIASGVPETILELDDLPVTRGRSMHGLVIQDGPIDLKSIRANLLCLEITAKRYKRAKGGTETSYFTKVLSETNILDVGEISLSAGERLQWDLSLDIPRDHPATGKIATDKRIEWKLEVWGRVRARPDFMHPFVIHVE